jgi:hypothetical protein
MTAGQKAQSFTQVLALLVLIGLVTEARRR